MKESKYYFGYGSNLNEKDLRAWCDRHREPYPFSQTAGTGWLPDRELVFDYESSSRGGGALNLRKRRGQLVPGVLFEVDEGGWETLDRKEGAPGCYRQVEVPVLLPDGTRVDAVTYEVAEGRREGRFAAPTREYAALVREGLLAHGLPAAMLEAVSRGADSPFLVRDLFVYGTLMRGECRHGVLTADGNLLKLEEATAPGRLHDQGECPALAEPENGERVRGELCRVADPGSIIASLDSIEGFMGYGEGGSLFRRAVVTCRCEDGEERPAWTYLFGSVPGGPAVAGGSWRSCPGSACFPESTGGDR